MIPDYSFNQSVRVVNVQNTETVRIKDSLWEINLKETTDVAVELIKKELSKRGFQIQDNAKKVLEIRISDVRYSLERAGLGNVDKWIVVLSARTGNGYFKKYQEYNLLEAWGVIFSDFAITKTVAKLLSDENIINYLKND